MGSTFVDGLGVGDVQDVALRDRRHLSEDGVLIVVATVGSQNGREIAAPEVISRGFAESDRCSRRPGSRPSGRSRSAWPSDVTELKLLQEHICTTTLGKLIAERTGRRPMILPVVVEV